MEDEDGSQEEQQGSGGDGQVDQDRHRLHRQVQAQEMQAGVQEILSRCTDGQALY